MLDAQIAAAGSISKFADMIGFDKRTITRWRRYGITVLGRNRLIELGVMQQNEELPPLPSEKPIPPGAKRKRCTLCRMNWFITLKPARDWICGSCKDTKTWKEGVNPMDEYYNQEKEGCAGWLTVLQRHRVLS